MMQMILVLYGIRMIMEYNLVSSRKKTFIDIQVTIPKFLETLLVTILFFLDFEKHVNNPKRFFITDLAIITFHDHAFEFNERINAICLPYTSKDDGRFLQNTGLTISGYHQCLNQRILHLLIQLSLILHPKVGDMTKVLSKPMVPLNTKEIVF